MVLPALLALLLAAPSDARQPIKLAAPGFSALDITQAQANFFSDHFAQQLTIRGVQVTTANQIGALIGFERQRQLLGCAENAGSCMAELAAALGVDGVITGSIGRFDQSYQVNISVVSSNDGRTLAAVSRNVGGSGALLEALNQAADQVKGDLERALRRTAGPPVPPPAAVAHPAAPRPPSPAVAAPPLVEPSAPVERGSHVWIPGIGGLAAGAAGGVLLALAGARAGELIEAGRNPTENPLNDVRAGEIASQGKLFQLSGLALVGLGAVGLGATGFLYFSSAPAQVSLQLAPGTAGLTVGGQWP